MTDVQSYSEKTFEDSKYVNAFGLEYWCARELCRVLDYTEWRNFRQVIGRAMEACGRAGYRVPDHFIEHGKRVRLGCGAVREVEEFHLSRYACYLIVMNGDSRKPSIALEQSYYQLRATQTDDTLRRERIKGAQAVSKTRS